MNYEQIQSLVDNIYNEYNVITPYKDIYRILDDIGIIIYEKQFLNSYEDDCIIDNRIFLISNKNNYVRLATLLGHFLLQLPEDNTYETSLPCNAFAVMFLIPEFEMQKDLKELSKKYGVNEDIAYYREQIFLDKSDMMAYVFE